MIFWALMAISCGVMYLLYRKGLAVTKSIRAVLFVFRPGKDGDRVTLNACTGWVRHRGRFRESGVYEFAFDAQLSKGDATVSVLDENKRQIVKLNRQCPAAKTELDARRRYYLRWELEGATGKCSLQWQSKS